MNSPHRMWFGHFIDTEFKSTAVQIYGFKWIFPLNYMAKNINFTIMWMVGGLILFQLLK